jgi:hypothetical protein
VLQARERFCVFAPHATRLFFFHHTAEVNQKPWPTRYVAILRLCNIPTFLVGPPMMTRLEKKWEQGRQLIDWGSSVWNGMTLHGLY